MVGNVGEDVSRLICIVLVMSSCGMSSGPGDGGFDAGQLDAGPTCAAISADGGLCPFSPSDGGNDCATRCSEVGLECGYAVQGGSLTSGFFDFGDCQIRAYCSEDFTNRGRCYSDQPLYPLSGVFCACVVDAGT